MYEPPKVGHRFYDHFGILLTLCAGGDLIDLTGTFLPPFSQLFGRLPQVYEPHEINLHVDCQFFR